MISEDLDEVVYLLTNARREGLEVEVIASAINIAKADPSLSFNQIVEEALRDWDI